MALVEWTSERVFNFVHRNNLVYNTCWEDPRLDRVALKLGPNDNVLVITSAGCNALDYVLTGPKGVYAVDMNPRQNALLELKISGIRNLDFDRFFELFGHGGTTDVGNLYRTKLRKSLSPFAQKYWDRHITRFFRPHRKRTFYFRGSSGTFAWMMNLYFNHVLHCRKGLTEMLAAKTLAEQKEIYLAKVSPKLWTKTVQFTMKRDSTLSLLGVPRAQRHQIDRTYPGGVGQFIRDSVDAVGAKLPLSDNYFWRVYLTGRYDHGCCPEYLKRENFAKLRGGLVDRVHIATDSVQGFLEKHDGEISRFVLLDHMDWLSTKYFPLLESEWQAIINRAAPGTRVIWRSGGLSTEFVDRVEVSVNGQTRRLGDLLTYDRALAAELHEQDRVHTYGSFYIADLAV